MTHHLMRAAATAAVAATALAALPAPAFGKQAGAEARCQALSAEEAARAGDPAFDYELGIAALDAGHFGAAIIAFQRVLAVKPDHAQARAELARAYAMAGDIDTARAQFATVVDSPDLPDPVRRRFTGFVRQLDKQIGGGGSDISGFAEAAIGHDSNINAATDLQTITIPLFAGLGPGTLGPAARVHRADRRRQRRDRRRTAGSAVCLGAGIMARQLGQSRLRSGQPHRHGRLCPHFRQPRRRLALGPGAAVLAGPRSVPHGIWPDRPIYPPAGGRKGAVGLAPVEPAGLQRRSLARCRPAGRAGDANSNRFAGASIGIEQPLSSRVAVVAGAAFDLRRYDEADPLFLKKRADERLDVSAGVKVAVLPSLFLQPKVTWSRNWSNVALHDHDRWTAAAGLRFEF